MTSLLSILGLKLGYNFWPKDIYFMQSILLLFAIKTAYIIARVKNLVLFKEKAVQFQPYDGLF